MGMQNMTEDHMNSDCKVSDYLDILVGAQSLRLEPWTVVLFAVHDMMQGRGAVSGTAALVAEREQHRGAESMN
jgi:hypothetical protein